MLTVSLKMKLTWIYCTIVVFNCIAKQCTGQLSTVNNNDLTPNYPEDFWNKMTIALNHHVHEKSDAIWLQWKNISDTLKLSKQCFDVVEYMIQHPIDQEWSAQMIDSMATFSAGLLSGSTTELGDFDQCVSTKGTFQKQSFVGKYCLATVHLPKREQFKPLILNQTILKPAWIDRLIEQWHHNDNWYALASAVCFPSICHQDEIQQILKTYYPVLELFSFNVSYCQSQNEPLQYPSGIWIAVFILCLSILPVIAGTAFEIFTNLNTVQSPVIRFCVSSFSLITNTKQLFGITEKNENDPSESSQFQFIHGIRVLASFYILFCHAFTCGPVPINMKVSAYARYPMDIKQTNKMLAFQPIFNGGLIVQTFFSMSGMLLTYNALASKLKIKFVPYVLLRWFRYTPPLIGSICMYNALQLLGNGPLFHGDLIWPLVRQCYTSWWQNLFFIHNFTDITEQCFSHTWYLSAEMQLYVIAFLLLLAYQKSPRAAYFTSAALIAFGIIIIFCIAVSGTTSLVLFQILAYTEYPVQKTSLKLLYFMPYMHCISYFSGCIIGQVLLEKRKLAISRSLNRFLSIFAAVIFVTFPFLSYHLIQQDKVLVNNTNLTTAAVIVTYLSLWAFTNAWFLYQCSVNPSSGLSRFLSAKIFHPFSRLSFSLYLVHLMTIWFNAHQTRTTISLANLNELYKQISLTYLQSLALAYLLYITFEAPSINLLKCLLKRSNTLAEKTTKCN